eukprot:SAG22_NODE_18156_length_292_cov_0.803109_1_plen_28_part_10
MSHCEFRAEVAGLFGVPAHLQRLLVGQG